MIKNGGIIKEIDIVQIEFALAYKNACVWQYGTKKESPTKESNSNTDFPFHHREIRIRSNDLHRT